MQLNQCLYGKQKAEWAGKALLEAFDKYLKTNRHENDQSVSDLEPLYRL